MCVVNVTRISLDERNAHYRDDKLDVASADGRSFQRVTDATEAAELVREFLQEWQLGQRW
jgi:hypothetical protein